MEKKLRIYVCIALAVAAALAAVFFVVRNMEVKTETSVKVFIAKDPVDIQTLSVSNSFGDYQVRSEEDGYVFDDIPANLVDVEGFYELMYHASAFGALRCVTEKADNLADYGLDAPKAAVKVAFSDGETFALSVGKEEPVSGNYYGSVDGDDGVYLFSEEDILYFLVRKETYITAQVTPELAVSSPLTAIRDITFAGRAFEKPITVKAVTDADTETKLLAKSFGPATHIVRLKGVYELDQTYGVEMLGSVLGIRALDVVGYNLSEEDLIKLGFDDPYFRVSFGLKNGTDYIADYELSMVPEKEYYLATMKDSGIVYRIEPPAFVGLDYTKLCMRWFLSPLLSDLKSVSVEGNGKKYAYIYSKSESGDVTVTANGQPIDKENFYVLYRLITGAASDGKYLEDPSAEGEPLLTIVYEYKDSAKPNDVMKLYKGSPRRVNVEVNGVVEFDMRASFVDALLLGCEHSLTGESIDENW